MDIRFLAIVAVVLIATINSGDILWIFLDYSRQCDWWGFFNFDDLHPGLGEEERMSVLSYQCCAILEIGTKIVDNVSQCEEVGERLASVYHHSIVQKVSSGDWRKTLWSLNTSTVQTLQFSSSDNPLNCNIIQIGMSISVQIISVHKIICTEIVHPFCPTSVHVHFSTWLLRYRVGPYRYMSISV